MGLALERACKLGRSKALEPVVVVVKSNRVRINASVLFTCVDQVANNHGYDDDYDECYYHDNRCRCSIRVEFGGINGAKTSGSCDGQFCNWKAGRGRGLMVG